MILEECKQFFFKMKDEKHKNSYNAEQLLKRGRAWASPLRRVVR
jgi:hypothetical protein